MRGRKEPPRGRGYAFRPLSDEELASFLRELAASLPDDVAARAVADLDSGVDPGEVARTVRDELRERGLFPL